MVWQFAELKHGWRGFNGDQITDSYPTLEEAQAEAAAIDARTGEGYTCGVCGRGFTPEEWADRHDNEEEEDRYFHAGCCPICGDPVDTSAIIYGEVRP